MSNGLDWVPMFIHRLKASDAWAKFKDYEFGWYWKLIVESYDSSNPGYLPNDIDVLWQLAGAKTKAYFQREGQSVLNRFHGRTADGLWIYHPVVLDVVQQQLPKLRKSKKKKPDDSSLSLSSPVLEVGFEVEAFDPEKRFNELCKLYPRREYTALAQQYYLESLEKVAKRHGIKRGEAADYILQRTKVYVSKCKFICGLVNYLQREVYEQDEAMWETEVLSGTAKQRQVSDAIDKAFS